MHGLKKIYGADRPLQAGSVSLTVLLLLWCAAITTTARAMAIVVAAVIVVGVCGTEGVAGVGVA